MICLISSKINSPKMSNHMVMKNHKRLDGYYCLLVCVKNDVRKIRKKIIRLQNIYLLWRQSVLSTNNSRDDGVFLVSSPLNLSFLSEKPIRCFWWRKVKLDAKNLCLNFISPFLLYGFKFSIRYKVYGIIITLEFPPSLVFICTLKTSFT